MKIEVHDRVRFINTDDPYRRGIVYSITESKWLGPRVHVKLEGTGPEGERLYADWLLEEVELLEDKNDEE